MLNILDEFRRVLDDIMVWPCIKELFCMVTGIREGF